MWMWRSACVVLALGISYPCSAQLIERRGEHNGVVVSRVDALGIAAAAASGRVTIEGMALPGEAPVTLSLRPFKITNDSTRFVLGTRDGDFDLDFDPSSFTFLRGEVAGATGSHVFLGVSGDYGTVGTIDFGGRRFRVSSDGGQTVSLAPDEVAVFEGVGTSAGMAGPGCAVESTWTAEVAPAGVGEPGTVIRQIEMAVETDYELFELYGDLDAEGAYILSLYAAIADVYIRDVNATILVTFVRLWDDPDDLWDAPDLGAFQSYWNNNMGDVHRDVAQFVSGNRFASAGGVAYLNGLCNQNSYSWSGYNLGYFATPDVPTLDDRDVSINAHELGHNCGTPHTHDIGIDTCDDEATPPTRGTIMAYCGQTFTGGQINNDLRFHTTVQEVIHEYLITRPCLAFDCNLNGIDDVLDIGGGDSEDDNGNGIPDECEDCNENGQLDNIDIAMGVSEDQNGNGIPDECEPDCNGNGVPDDLDFSGSVSIIDVNDFETDEGWIAENLGATSGDWERGVPVNDPVWEHDPVSDSDGSGQCYLTSNVPGNSDVDDGGVRLTSAEFDLTGPANAVVYDYFLRLTNQNGNDRILVDVSANGLAGPWTVVNVHDSDGGLSWRTGVVTAADMMGAGVTPSSTMRMRFTANDGNPQSIVEAGLDQFIIGTYSAPVSVDAQGDGVPDECEEDFNENGTSDYTEIQLDMSLDLDRNAKLDAFEDCDDDGVTDLAQIDGAFDAWIAGIGQDGLREYLSLIGTVVRQTAPAGITEGHDVVITPDGRVLVSSAGDDRVVQFAMDGSLIGDLVGPGVGGLDGPHGLLLPGDGRLLVASGFTNSVLAFNETTGAFLGVLVAPGAGGLVGPFAMKIGPDGALYVTSDAGEVLMYNASTGAPLGAFVSSADNGGLTSPRGLVFLPDGPLLVTSYGTNEVLSYDASTGAPLGKWNRNGTPTVLTLDQPWDIEIGPEGDVYVARTHDDESGGGGGGGGAGGGLEDAWGRWLPLHLTNARIYIFDHRQGNMLRAYVMGVDSGIDHPTGFAFAPGASQDCNQNLKPDSCDIASGVSQDANGNGVPDECEDGCVADFNGDGNLNILDFVALQGAFQAGDPSADINGDGNLNILDFVAYQQLFLAGCE